MTNNLKDEKEKVTFLRKFQFADLNLAYKVRGNMRSALIKFDDNHNEHFEEA